MRLRPNSSSTYRLGPHVRQVGNRDVHSIFCFFSFPQFLQVFMFPAYHCLLSAFTRELLTFPIADFTSFFYILFHLSVIMKYEHRPITLYIPDVILIALYWFVESNSFLVPFIAVSAVAGVVIIVAVILVIMLIKQRADNKGSCTKYI